MAELGYILRHSGQTVDDNVALAGTAVQLQYGYLHNGAFYTDNTYTTVIPANTRDLYVDIPTLDVYGYRGSAYVHLNVVALTWGSITGDIASQTDLATALNAKANATDVTNALANKVNKTQTIGSTALSGNVTAENIINDIKAETKTFTNTTMSGDNNTFSNIALGSLKNQGTANANKQLIINATGDVALSDMKVTYSFSTKTIDSYNHTWFITSVTNGTNTMHTAVSMTNPSLVYHSKDNTNWYLSYSEWRA